MIRYEVTREEIEGAINSISDTWLSRAAERTDQFIQQQEYKESSSIWSKVKPVFMALQANKCVFCERQFENAEYGRIEHDLEHFRPKSSVKRWPSRSDQREYGFDTGDSSDNGYYWLAYNLGNYAAACGVCNSTLKSNYFPIAGHRVTTPNESLNDEQAFLCYPVGTDDTDPEELLTFEGTIAKPKFNDSDDYQNHRGQIMIDLFRLNEREILHRERARMIVFLGHALQGLDNGQDVDINTQIAQQLLTGTLPHTACCRAFHNLWNADQAMAVKYFERCRLIGAGIVSALR